MFQYKFNLRKLKDVNYEFIYEKRQIFQVLVNPTVYMCGALNNEVLMMIGCGKAQEQYVQELKRRKERKGEQYSSPLHYAIKKYETFKDLSVPTLGTDYLIHKNLFPVFDRIMI